MDNSRHGKVIHDVEAVVNCYAALRFMDGVEKIDFTTIAFNQADALEKANEADRRLSEAIEDHYGLIVHTRIVNITIVVNMPPHRLHYITPLYDD